MKQYVKQVLKHFDLDIVQTGHRRTVMDFLFDRRIDLVLDVGANEGQFARSLRHQGYTGRIHSFEPVSASFERLSESATGDPEWDAYNFALGATTERTTINVSRSSVYSSMLPLADAGLQFDRTASANRVESIEIRTLDAVLPQTSVSTFLKVDTQGYEKQVLDGARATLPSLKGILMELPIIQLYEGVWRFHEALEFMAEANFVPAQIHPVNFHPGDAASLVEVDCLFRPWDPRLDGHVARNA